MKKGKIVSKVITGMFLVLAAAYIGVNVYDYVSDPLVTEPAVMASVIENGTTDGYIIRTETIVTAGGDAVAASAFDGEKVAAGQTLAIKYSGEEAIQRAGSIKTLETRISQLESLLSSGNEDTSKSAAKAAKDLASAAARGDLSQLTELSLRVESYIFGNETADEEELLELKTELARLESINEGIEYISAQMSGTFTSVTDGYESISPDEIRDITPSALKNKFSDDAKKQETAIGKLVTGSTWYYAAVMEKADAERLAEGESVEIKFYGNYTGTLSMNTESIGPEEEGSCVVLFSCRTSLAETASLRELSGEIIFSENTGLKVSKSSVYSDEDGAYIFVISGLQAKKIYIDIICEIDAAYLVEGELRAGTEVISKAQGLYDGKVVR